MRRFQFRLERIFRIREHKAKQIEIELARAVSDCILLENRIKAVLEERYYEARTPYHETDISYRISQSAYLSYLDNRLTSLRKQLAEAEAVRDEVQKRYLEASKEEKVLQKLREHKESEHYREQIKEENGVIDEISLNKYTRVAHAKREADTQERNAEGVMQWLSMNE